MEVSKNAIYHFFGHLGLCGDDFTTNVCTELVRGLRNIVLVRITPQKEVSRVKNCSQIMSPLVNRDIQGIFVTKTECLICSVTWRATLLKPVAVLHLFNTFAGSIHSNRFSWTVLFYKRTVIQKVLSWSCDGFSWISKGFC